VRMELQPRAIGVTAFAVNAILQALPGAARSISALRGSPATADAASSN
jgi:hypothetical protein